jgi:hypothetical protein
MSEPYDSDVLWSLRLEEAILRRSRPADCQVRVWPHSEALPPETPSRRVMLIGISRSMFGQILLWREELQGVRHA